MYAQNNPFRRAPKPLKVLMFLAMGAAFLLVMGTIVMLLWNAILPEITGWKTLNFWEATGLLVLSRILFGGFGRGGRSGSKERSKWRKNWKHMSAEDKEKFKARWKKHCDRKDE